MPLDELMDLHEELYEAIEKSLDKTGQLQLGLLLEAQYEIDRRPS